MVAALLLSLILSAGEGPLCFTAELPAGWRESARVHLVLERVSVPANQPLKLRVSCGASGNEEFLGSLGVEAQSPTAEGEHRLESVRLDVTRGLQRALAKDTAATNVRLCAQPVDGRNQPLHISWSIAKASLVIPK